MNIYGKNGTALSTNSIRKFTQGCWHCLIDLNRDKSEVGRLVTRIEVVAVLSLKFNICGKNIADTTNSLHREYASVPR